MVRALSPAGATVRTRRVDHSFLALTGLQKDIADSMDAWASRGITVAYVGIDVIGNRVLVAVVDVTEEKRSQLSAAYGDAIEVIDGELPHEATCNSRTDCRSPLKGGLSITGGGWVCSSGFLGRPESSFTQLYVLTAGHCLQDSGLAANWSHQGVIGHGAFEDFYNGSTADVGAIYASEAGAKNQVFANGTADIRSITAELSIVYQQVGGAICRSGQTSGWRCGTIATANTDVNVSFPGGTYLLHHQWITNYPSQGGDSGGSMILVSDAAGILSAITSTQTFYSQIDWIIGESGKRPCYTSACG